MINGDLISIIIPVYNVEHYLARCIDSILAQTYQNIEIILIDDGSTDNSGIICDNYAMKNSHIKIIHQKNSGTIIARNEGLKIARGKYVGFIDSDDYIKPQMFENLYDCISSGNYDIVWCDVIIELSDKQITTQFDNSEDPFVLLSELLRGNYQGWLCNKLFSMDFYHKCNIYQDPKCSTMEDCLIMTQLIYHKPKLKYLNQALYIYNKTNENSLTATNLYQKCLTNLKHIEHFLVSQNIFDIYKSDFSILAMKVKIGILNKNQFFLAKNIFPYAHKHLNNYPFQNYASFLYYIFFNCGKFGYLLYKLYSMSKKLHSIRKINYLFGLFIIFKTFTF